MDSSLKGTITAKSALILLFCIWMSSIADKARTQILAISVFFSSAAIAFLIISTSQRN
ncbi:MAG: hypothetical protein V7K96_05270 [Nostoc sp.]